VEAREIRMHLERSCFSSPLTSARGTLFLQLNSGLLWEGCLHYTTQLTTLAPPTGEWSHKLRPC